MVDIAMRLRIAKVIADRWDALVYLTDGSAPGSVPIPKSLIDRIDALEEMAQKIYAHKGFTKDAALKAFGDVEGKDD